MEKKIKNWLEEGNLLPPDLEGWERVILPSKHLVSPNLDKKKVWKKIQNQLKPSTFQTSFSRTLVGIAASSALILSFFIWSNKDYERIKFNEPSEFNFSEGSVVHGNEHSTLIYYPQKWNSEREVKLIGEAYFEVVQHKAPFKVETTYGSIEVVGTKFNIHSREKYFKLTCNEGTVNFVFKGDTIILKAPTGIQIINDELKEIPADYSKPAWIDGIFEYHDFPLDLVFSDLEKKYSVKIGFIGKYQGRKFNGKLPNDNFELALRILSQTMDLSIQRKSDNEVVFYNDKKMPF